MMNDDQGLRPIGRFSLKNGTIVRLVHHPDGLMIAFDKSCLEKGDIILLDEKFYHARLYSLPEKEAEELLKE